MQDPAINLRAARSDLKKSHRLLDHVLKEIADTPIGSTKRLERIRVFALLEGHQRALRREVEASTQSLRSEQVSCYTHSQELTEGQLPDLDLDTVEQPDAEEAVVDRRRNMEEFILCNLLAKAGMRPLPTLNNVSSGN